MAKKKETQKGREVAKANVKAKKTSGIGVTKHSDGRPIKGLKAEKVTAKPTRHMLQVIAKKHKHPGMGLVFKRWHLYKEGMTLLDAKTTDGLVVSDITFWARKDIGLITLRQCTDKEYEKAVADWESGKGRKVKADKPAKGSGKRKTAPQPPKADVPAPASETPSAETPADAKVGS